jgi:hypothetical protein
MQALPDDDLQEIHLQMCVAAKEGLAAEPAEVFRKLSLTAGKIGRLPLKRN